MEGMDLFATKGIEYMLVIGYLLLLVGCRRMVGPRQSEAPRERTGLTPQELQAFKLRDGLLYHQGHTWAAPNGNGRMRVGLDDFAQKLLGPLAGVIPPPLGTYLVEGEPGWKVRVERKAIPMLSPVEGHVVAWNTEALRSPGLVNRDPYGGGWLLEVAVPHPAAARRNLLSGTLARAWMNNVAEEVEHLAATRSAPPSFRGASNEVGLARLLAPDRWDETARSFLLSGEDGDTGDPDGVETYEEDEKDRHAQMV